MTAARNKDWDRRSDAERESLSDEVVHEDGSMATRAVFDANVLLSSHLMGHSPQQTGSATSPEL